MSSLGIPRMWGVKKNCGKQRLLPTHMLADGRGWWGKRVSYSTKLSSPPPRVHWFEGHVRAPAKRHFGA